MSTYRIGEQIIKHDDDSFHGLLATVHGIKKRPFCLCRPTGIEMYISKLDGKYIVKRMPNTGGEHAQHVILMNHRLSCLDWVKSWDLRFKKIQTMKKRFSKLIFR